MCGGPDEDPLFNASIFKEFLRANCVRINGRDKLSPSEVNILLKMYQTNALIKLHNFYEGRMSNKKHMKKLSKEQLVMKLEHILSGARKKTIEQVGFEN